MPWLLLPTLTSRHGHSSFHWLSLSCQQVTFIFTMYRSTGGEDSYFLPKICLLWDDLIARAEVGGWWWGTSRREEECCWAFFKSSPGSNNICISSLMFFPLRGSFQMNRVYYSESSDILFSVIENLNEKKKMSAHWNYTIMKPSGIRPYVLWRRLKQTGFLKCQEFKKKHLYWCISVFLAYRNKHIFFIF